MKRIISVIIMIIMSTVLIVSEETDDNSKCKKIFTDKKIEKKLQLGFGFSLSSGSITTLHNNKRELTFITDMDYAFDFRIMKNLLMFESLVSFIPHDQAIKKTNFSFVNLIGLRCPYTFMPYILAGLSFNIHGTKASFSSAEWKNIFSLGFVSRIGLDIKFRQFSISAYYQYNIIDFSYFKYWGEMYKEKNISDEEAVTHLLNDFSRIGIVFTYYGTSPF